MRCLTAWETSLLHRHAHYLLPHALLGPSGSRAVPKALQHAALQWLLLGDEKSAGKERAWGRKHLCSAKGWALHGRTALINALLQQQLDPTTNVLFKS